MPLVSDATCSFALVLVLCGFGNVYAAEHFVDENFEPKVIHDVNIESTKASQCVSGGPACVSICCQPGLYYKSSKCIANDSTPASNLQYPEIFDEDLQSLNRSMSDFIAVYHTPCEHGGFFLRPKDDAFYFLENGQLYMPDYYDGVKLGVDGYCLASKLETNGSVTKVVVCAPKQRDDDQLFLLYPVTLLLSVPFLAMTIIVYSVIPALRNLHGLCLRTHMTILCLSFIIIATMQLIETRQLGKTVLCKTLAIIRYFLYLGNFFWLNVMCFDIWWTFSSIGLRSMRSKQRERREFLMYSLYAWGSIFVLTGICIIMDHIPRTHRSIIPRPGFGVVRCWFHTRAATALYFYGPMGFTVICNVCLFISTAVKIVRHERKIANQFKSTESKRHIEEKQRFHVCLKLFIMMGLNWTMEIISWSVDNEPKYLWNIIDMGNTLQGPILFFVLVWNSRVKGLLVKRFSWLNVKFLFYSSRSMTFEIPEDPHQPKDDKEAYHINQAFEEN